LPFPPRKRDKLRGIPRIGTFPFAFLLIVLLTLSSFSATFAELIPITLNHDGPVTSVAFSPDGNLLATGSYDYTAKVWEMPSGKLIATLKHDDGVNSVTFSPYGNLLATGSYAYDNTAKVWEMPSGNLIATLKHDDGVNSVTFSPDGKLLATGSGDYNTAKVWVPNTDDIPKLTQPSDGSKFVDALPKLKWEKLPNVLL
jgi:WD40 repeat protein